MLYQNSMDMTDVRIKEQNFITRVYGWMSFALAVTGLVSLYIASNPALISKIATGRFLLIGLIIAELILVVAITSMINRLSFFAASTMFVIYSVLNGVTFSTIFLVYTMSSIASTFFATAGTFAVMSCYGWYTKKDLTTIGNICVMALIGIIIASLVNMFLQSSGLYWIITYAGILIFVGLIAYDTQKIKAMAGNFTINSEEGKKGALLGALALYLDFINLFLMLLRIFGDRK
ncbi:MAG: Bax inhibitor-1/YccA family protein [bacterium]